MSEPSISPDAREVMEEAAELLHSLSVMGALGHRISGSAEADGALWQLAGQWIERHHPDPATPRSGAGPVVFLSTAIYRHGGHTALMGDFVEALRGLHPPGFEPMLILTGTGEPDTGKDSAESVKRAGMDASRVEVVAGEDPGSRLDWLLRRLLDLDPSMVFLFHFPFDAVAAAAGCRPEICGRRFLVHHTDTTPAFGLFVPGMTVIDLHAHGAALSRSQGLASALLPLTCPDPGPRPPFPADGPLTTAACGSQHKFEGDFFYPYYRAVGDVLAVTRGRHVHIGPLADGALEAIRESVSRAGASGDSFLHIGLAPDLQQTLWDLGCGLFLNSWPNGGARTRVDVSSAGIPIACRTPLKTEGIDPLVGGGILEWSTPGDLRAVLQTAGTRLAELGGARREFYERVNHPDRFRQTLADILQGGPGVRDPWVEKREGFALRETVAAVTREMGRMKRVDAAIEREARNIRRLQDEQEKRIAFLDEQLGKQKEKSAKLKSDFEVFRRTRSPSPRPWWKRMF